VPSHPSLSISALGVFQLLQDGNPAPKFKYLDSREFLVYLLVHATLTPPQAKSKQEIGAALWGDLSDSQLNARFKARLNDVRHVLGARDWILFEQETYRFKLSDSVTFDVFQFLTACDDAETHHRAGNIEAERATRSRALTLYRGDFLQDYHTRSRKDFFGEREWYLVLRETLQGKYRHVLEQLARLELQRDNYDAAVEHLSKLVALDEYDDRAHLELMRALSLQGKRSRALRHYHDLLKERPDTPPDPDLTALFERIKRGQPLDALKPSTVQPSGQAFAELAPLPPPFQVPADLPRFVGRAPQFARLRAELLGAVNASSIQDSAPPAALCLIGMGGIGKTSLAIHAAYRVREHFPDGVLWGNLRESEPLAILGSWERAFGCDFSTLPDLNARAASLRSLLHDKRVLVILDDVVDASAARPLLLNGEHTRTIFTSRSAEIAAALGATLLQMPVLEADESADLLTRVLGQARVARQDQFAQSICHLLGHLPLALDITAQRLVSRPHWTLRDMADRLQEQMQRLDELQLADRAVRATFALSWDTLDPDQQNVLAHVGIFQARSFTAPALAFIAQVEDSHARDLLDDLVSLSLLSFESNTRYRQHPLLADFSLEMLHNVVSNSDNQALNQKSEIKNQQSPVSSLQSPIPNYQLSIINYLSSAHSRFSQYYLSFAAAHRRDYLALEDEWDNLNVGITIAHAEQTWKSLIDYGDILTDAWFARGRFTDARHNYPLIMRAARELEEQDPYIAASLNWGKACIEHGDYAEAAQHLQHGLQTSREVNDEYWMAQALYLHARLDIVRFEYEQAQPVLEQCEELYKKLGDRAGLAQIYYFRARIHMERENYPLAEEWVERAFAIQKELEPNRVLVLVLRYMGRIKDYLDKPSEAITYGNQALSLAQSLQDLTGYAQAMYDLTAILRDRGTLEKAREHGIQSVELLRKIGDRKLESYANEQLTIIEYRRGAYLPAVEYAVRSLALAREIGETNQVAYALVRLGDAYEKLDRLADACRARSEALPLAKNMGHPRTSEIETWLRRHCTNA
jgi:DNA-binding SARP family transcriptional activator